MWSTVYPRSYAVELLKKLRLFDGDVGIYEAEFVRGCARFWRGGDKVVVVGIAGAWDINLMDTVLVFPSPSIVTVFDRTLMKRKGPSA